MDKKPEATDPESDSILTTTDLDTNEGKVILSNKINKEIDKIFGPAIQRNRSGSDLEIIGPFRRRHFWSQERLFSDKPQHNQAVDISNEGLNSFQIDELKSLDESKTSQIPVLHENQRAEIVASVTERLYSKLKKNEKNISKIESVLDRKSIQPLSELKICSNARQRLMELSQKALRNKRRIGIPAYTQTKSQVTRVKNQGIEIQTDLQSLIELSQRNTYTLRKDAGIQTDTMTPRLKENAVGSNYDVVNFNNKDTATQTNIAFYKDNMTMTHVVSKNNHSTQTFNFHETKRNNNDFISKIDAGKSDSSQSVYKDYNNLSPFININISPIYSHDSGDSSDSEVLTEDDSESFEDNTLIFNNKKQRETSICENEIQNEFSDDDYSVLPRVVVDPIRNTDIVDYEELILGRNDDNYPYNIKLTPCKKVEENKRVIKFKDNLAIDRESKGDEIINDKNTHTEPLLNLPAPEYSREEGTGKTESVHQNSIQIKNENHLQDDDDKEINCENIEIYESNTIEHTSPITLLNVYDADETESDTSLYYSLNSFFKRRHKKRTPTEYLHYLIQKRREAISLDSSRFYQRNISF